MERLQQPWDRRRRILVALLAGVLIMIGPAVMRSAADTGDIGVADQNFTGVSNPPTADKPQSKLWFNDGLWWATMFDRTSLTWHIFRLDRPAETWVDTGVQVDNRPQTLSDALWNGQKLYIASQWVTVSSEPSPKASLANRPARLYRYSYDRTTKTYALDAGFPAAINNNSSESLTIDQDTTGRIWATWTQVSGSSSAGYTSTVYVNSSATGEVWETPTVLPVDGVHPAPDDISAVVAFGGNKIGVLWSNQVDQTMYWATRTDSQPLTNWTGGIAVRGPRQSDDHMNLKTLQADEQGRVYAAVKTSLDELSGAPASSPQINLMVYRPGTGAWSTTPFGTLADCHTRPAVVLDDENSEVHVFATGPSTSGCPYAGAPGTIYEKVASMSDPVFPAGRGTPVIRDADSASMNNVSATKQSVNSHTGLVVLASNESTKTYWHADLTIAGAPVQAVPTASFTESPTTGTAPLTVQFTDTSTGSPTSWQWDFGNGSTSTQQNPSVTYAAAGSYLVTMTATNGAGTSAPTTETVTVTEPPVSAGIVRESISTSVAAAPDSGLTIAKPTGTSAGDLLVSCVTIDGGSLPATKQPDGWTRIAGVTDLTNPRVYGFTRLAGASEPDSYRWGFSSTVISSGGIARYSGASGLDSPVATATGASGSSGTVPGVTTVSAQAMVVGCLGINSGATSITITGPPDLTEAWDLGGKRQEFDDGVQATPGPSGSKTWGFSASRAWAGWVTALRPQSAG